MMGRGEKHEGGWDKMGGGIERESDIMWGGQI